MTTAHGTNTVSGRAWGIMFILLLLLFFIITFPFRQLQATLLSTLSQKTGLLIRATDSEMVWPFGIRWRGLTVEGKNFHPLHINSLHLSLGVGSLFRGTPTFSLRADFTENPACPIGEISTTVVFDSFSFDGPGSLSGTVRIFQPGALGIPYVAEGLIQGDIQHQWEGLSPPFVNHALLQGEGSITVAATTLVVQQLFMGSMALPPIHISTAMGQMHCRKGRCRIPIVRAEGPAGHITGTGRLILQPALQNSLLDLPITVTPSSPSPHDGPFQTLARSLQGSTMHVMLLGPLSNITIKI